MSKTLKLTLNIGTDDARRLGLEEVKEGKTVHVSKEAADELIRRGLAVEPPAKADEPDRGQPRR